jgi:hypothetical protein
MARIVFVHGINHEQSGADLVLEKWLPALRSGMQIAAAKWHIQPPTLPVADDVRVAFWGDLFRRRTALSAELPPYDAQDLTTEDGELLALVHRRATEIGEIRTTGSELGGFHDGLRAALYQVASTSFCRSMWRHESVRNLVGLMKAVNQYMKEDDETYRLVQNRVDQAIEPDTRLVIGHSLGSVIAYEALCRSGRHVDTLVTLGSPLGTPTAIYDRLRSGWVEKEDGARVRQRPGIRRWLNVSGSRDILAVVPRLSPLFDFPEVEDVIIDVGPDSSVNVSALHDICAHLTHDAVGKAIFEALSGIVALDLAER